MTEPGSAKPIGERGLAVLHRLVRSGHLRAASSQFLIAAVVLLIVGLLALGSNIGALDEHFRQVRLTNETLRELGDIDRENVGIEHSVRGLALSGNAEFIQFYKMRKANLLDAIRKLMAASGGDAGQRRQVQRLEQSLVKRLAVLDVFAFDPRLARAAFSATMVDPAFRASQHLADLVLVDLKTKTMRDLNALQDIARQNIERSYWQDIAFVAVAFVLAVMGMSLWLADRRFSAGADRIGVSSLRRSA